MSYVSSFNIFYRSIIVMFAGKLLSFNPFSMVSVSGSQRPAWTASWILCGKLDLTSTLVAAFSCSLQVHFCLVSSKEVTSVIESCGLIWGKARVNLVSLLLIIFLLAEALKAFSIKLELTFNLLKLFSDWFRTMNTTQAVKNELF